MNVAQRFSAVAVIGLTMLFVLPGAPAAEHVLKAAVSQWDPIVLFVQPGDTVKFTNMIGHDLQNLDHMIPEGAQAWKAQLGQEGFSVKLDVEGAYIYKCNPHMSLGMVGAIVVGPTQPANLEAIEAALPNIQAGRNMVARTIRKLKAAIEQQGK